LIHLQQEAEYMKKITLGVATACVATTVVLAAAASYFTGESGRAERVGWWQSLHGVRQ
jgi:hypothetical protein